MVGAVLQTNGQLTDIGGAQLPSYPNGSIFVTLTTFPSGPIGTLWGVTGPDANGNYTPVVWVPPLATVQAAQIASLWSQMLAIQQSAFDLDFTQFYLHVMLTFSIEAKLTNRTAYLTSAFQWIGYIYFAYIAAQNAVNAALTVAAVQAVTLGPTQTQTGNLSSGGVLTGLTSTAQISVGMTVTGTGISGNATVATVPSGTEVTLTGGTYTAETGQSYTFALPVAPVVTIAGGLAINN